MIDPKSSPRGHHIASYPVGVGHLGASWGRLGSKKVANMAPTWLPKWSQDDPKIHQNLDHFLDASWDRFFYDFWSIFSSKMEASWDQNRSKIDVNFERRFFEKTLIFRRKNNDFEGSGGRSWVQKSIKNQSKNGVQDGVPLGIDFWWILMVFGRQVRSPNRRKIDLKRHRKND